MAPENLRQRHLPLTPVHTPKLSEAPSMRSEKDTQHPRGVEGLAAWQQALRMFLFAAYFNGSCIALV
jgi:lysocardiolipin and lysophospholipid acyltransferase